VTHFKVLFPNRFWLTDRQSSTKFPMAIILCVPYNAHIITSKRDWHK